ncbi:MAG TPA: hypothetical protein VFU19_17080 [Iamia sp.]|nr:hypothetical protein [Iamia sp.]
MPEPDEHILHPGRGVIGWRWIGTEVQADRSFVIAGGLATTAALGLVEAIGRRRCQRTLDRLAQPSWRPLGPLWVVTTNVRLAVHHHGAWSSIWLASVRDAEVDADGTALVMQFASDPPYALRWLT